MATETRIALNSANRGSGRFCNRFFRNMMAHILAEKNGLPMNYHDHNKMKALGLDLHENGLDKDTNVDPIVINDGNFMKHILDENPLPTNIRIDPECSYCQTRDFALYMREYFIKHKWFDAVLNRNKFKERYKNNEDIYIHVRLGDVAQFNPGFEYYDLCLSKIIEYRDKTASSQSLKRAFISSDSIHDPLCRQLIEKYGLIELSTDEIDTILFASTCRYVVLSNGTFSWLIGFLGVFSQVFYPKIYQLDGFWHGNIFVFPHWTEVAWKKSI